MRFTTSPGHGHANHTNATTCGPIDDMDGIGHANANNCAAIDGVPGA